MGRRAPRLALGMICAAAACGPPPVVDVAPGAPDVFIDVAAGASVASALVDPGALLADAVARYEASRLERLIEAVDPFERFETLYYPGGVEALAEAGDYETLFLLGDEAFEVERDRAAGFGQGPPAGPALPARPRRVHDGERGGLDASACRSCHFSGGPDGSGSSTQVGLFRGDGRHLGTAVVRDAPHVMGLGYLSALTEWLNLNLEAQALSHLATAEATGLPVYEDLVVDGIDFGNVTFFPDGTWDAAGLEHLSPDLRVRPFGHKGRHATLTALVDEALQVHHGHQSSSREAVFSTDPETFLGPGPEGDRDDDGIADEASDAQAVVLATYLSLLPVPMVRPPADPTLQLAFARGSTMFDEVGCGECHRRDLALQIDSFLIEGQGDSGLVVPMSPLVDGEDPKPERIDFGSSATGTPLFAFTDLRRHDLGPALADPVAEPLPDGSDVIAGEVWLTRPLWGLADTAPYLHDGRAPTVHDAILLHGGEASVSRIAYAGLSDDDQAALRVFLLSLTRAPTVLVE